MEQSSGRFPERKLHAFLYFMNVDQIGARGINAISARVHPNEKPLSKRLAFTRSFLMNFINDSPMASGSSTARSILPFP
jgi:hypothetical protein